VPIAIMIRSRVPRAFGGTLAPHLLSCASARPMSALANPMFAMPTDVMARR